LAIFAISDLHLAKSVDKPMDIFGSKWTNYMEKIEENWNQIVKEDDCVIIPGDISWATYLEEAYEDFSFINSLPGNKVISKGNHDYWWTTSSKLLQYTLNNNFSTLSFLQNNSFRIGNVIICGTRGWLCPGDDGFKADDRKIFNREIQRLELSIKSASKDETEHIIVAMHYPPFNSKKEPTEFVEVMKKYGVKTCVFGHLHGESYKNAVVGNNFDIDFKLISADSIGFKPLRLID